MPVEVAEPLTGCGLECAPDRSKPGTARKLVEIGTARTQIDLDRGRWVASGSGTCRDRGVCDRRRPTRASLQAALGDELVTCLHHDAARRAELGREGARRRQDRVRRQASGADGVTESLLELAMQWRHVGPVERDVELERATGPSFRHQTGPYQQTGLGASS